MSEGFNRLKNSKESKTFKDIKQTDYNKMVKQMNLEEKKNITAKANFKRPPYCVGDKRREWEQKNANRDITE